MPAASEVVVASYQSLSLIFFNLDNIYFFQNYAEILKKSGRERDEEHFIRYFKLRNSQIIRLEDHLFMGMKIEHLYIHDCSKYIHQ